MSAAELRLTYSPDDEWLGELNAVVRSGAFAGQGSAWFDRLHLKEAFVDRLRAFPLSAAIPPTIEGGFWSKKDPGSLDQCHLRIVVSPYNSRGTLLVRVDLATQSRDKPDIDQQQSVTARFLTEYAAAERFGEDIGHVLEGSMEIAVLKGNTI
jgi:hypothetical protein